MMGNRRSSSGKYSQDSQLLASSNRFKNLWMNNSVIQCSSKAGSSSCQCTMTLYGENKETQKSVKIIHLQLRTMLSDFLAVIGHSWDLDQKRNGTELILTNQMVIGTELLNEWCSTFAESSHPIFRATSALERGDLRSKGGARRLSISTVASKTLNWSCAQSFLQISSVSTELQQICARRYPKIPWLQGNQKHMILWRRWKFLPNLEKPTLALMNSDGESCCKNTSNNYLTTRSFPNYAPTLAWRLRKEDNISSQVWCRRTERNGTFVQWIHEAS